MNGRGASESVRPSGPGPRPPPPPPPPPLEVPARRLLATLGTAGALAGLLVVLVFQVTEPRIRAHKAEVLRAAIQEVLKAPHRYDTLYVYDGALTARLPDGVDVGKLERVFLGYRESGEPIGFAIAAGEPGFQDMVELIFGYDPEAGKILGMKVLESRETPGLGDKIEKDEAFIAEFEGAEPPLVGVKAGRGAGSEPAEIDMITGATISSRTVISIINHAIERLGPLLAAYGREGGR